MQVQVNSPGKRFVESCLQKEFYQNPQPIFLLAFDVP